MKNKNTIYRRSRFFTKQEFEKLLENGKDSAKHITIDGETKDFWPVVKLFTPDSSFTWLINELDPKMPDIGFGLVHNNRGAEFGYFSITELESVRGALGLPIEKDLFFEAAKPVSKYKYDEII